MVLPIGADDRQFALIDRGNETLIGLGVQPRIGAGGEPLEIDIALQIGGVGQNAEIVQILRVGGAVEGKAAAPVLIDVERAIGENGIAEIAAVMTGARLYIQHTLVEILPVLAHQGRPLLGRQHRGEGKIGGFAERDVIGNDGESAELRGCARRGDEKPGFAPYRGVRLGEIR